MQISALKLALGTSVLFHGLAFSLVSWGLRDGMGAGSINGSPRPNSVLELVQVPENEAPDEPAKPLPVAALSSAMPSSPAAIQTPACTPADSPQEPAGITLPDLSELLALEQASETTIPAVDSTAVAKPVLMPMRTGPEFSSNGAQVDAAGDANSGDSEAVGAPGSGGGGESLASPADYLSNPKPNYPRLARLRRQEGVVVLSVRVTADGLPAEVRVKRGSSFELLDEAALRAVRHWRFTPARKGNRTAACQIEVPIRFEMTN